MADLDIVIKLDPTQPVTGAKAVTAEVAKLETQATKSAGAVKRVADDAAAGIAKMNFKQAAAGAAQAFGLINEKLKITDSEIGKAAESAVKFGAIGAQLAGPWGALAGALVGVALEGKGTFDLIADAQYRALESTRTYAQVIADFARTMQMLQVTTLGVNAAFANTQAIVNLAAKQVGEFNEMLKLSGATGAKEYHEKIDSLNRIIKDHPEQADLARRAIDALNKSHDAGAASVTNHTAAVNSYAEAVRRANTPQYDGEIPDAISGGVVPGEGYREVDVGGLKPMENKRLTADDVIRDLTEMQKANADYSAKAAEETAKQAESAKQLQDAIGSMDDVFKSSLVSSAQAFSSALVDAANGADVSWSNTFESMFQGLQKAITQALILKALTGSYSGAAGADGKAIGGLFGALGFASGGTIYPSGGGTADTQSVSFRKRPDETVHINTPQQEQAYQRGGQSGSRTQTVNVQADDHRALLQGFDGPDGDRVVLNVLRRNPSAANALLRR